MESTEKQVASPSAPDNGKKIINDKPDEGIPKTGETKDDGSDRVDSDVDEDGGASEEQIDEFDKQLDDKSLGKPYNPNTTAFQRIKALNEKINRRIYNEAMLQFETNEDLETGRPKVPLPSLPRVNFFWLLLLVAVYTTDTLLTISTVTFVSWSGLSQREFIDMYMFTDYRPEDLVLTNPVEFQVRTIEHICSLVGCNNEDLNSSLWNAKNCSFTRTGKLLTTGMMGVDITFKNPREWGWPALSTQTLMFTTEAKNPLGEMYSKATEGLLTPLVVSSLNVSRGPEEKFPPKTSWLFVAASFLGITTIANLLIVCCLDPEINIDPATARAFEENKAMKISDTEKLVKDARARGMLKDAKGHETAIAALKETKLPRMKFCAKMWRYFFVLLKCELVLWAKISKRKGRESFLILLFKLSTTILQTFPMMTMILYLGFSQPRRFSALMICAVLFSITSAALTICLWEKNQLKAERGETMRVCSTPAFWLFGGRFIEIFCRGLFFALLGASWGPIMMAVFLVTDYLVMHGLVIATWYQANKSFNGIKTLWCGALRRAIFIAPTLTYVYHDHYTGRVEQNTYIRPNLYYTFRALESIIGIPLILAKAPGEDLRADDSALTMTLGTVLLSVLTLVMYTFSLPNMFKQLQQMRLLAKTGVNFPVPQRWKSLENLKLGKLGLREFKGMDKSGADLLARYGNKIEEMDAAAAKRNEGEFDDLGDMDDDEEDEFAYKERLLKMANNSVKQNGRLTKCSTYVFEGVDIDQKLKDAEELVKEADAMLKSTEDLRKEVKY